MLDWCTHTAVHRPVHKQALGNNSFFSSAVLFSPQFDCCGVNSPEDFKDSLFRLNNQNHMVPEACCQRASQSEEMASISQEQCLSGNMMFRNNKVTSDIYTVKLFSPSESHPRLIGAGDCWRVTQRN